MISMTTTVIVLLAKLVVVSSQEDWRYTDINECESSVNPCKNGGTCRDTVGSFECICLEQWSGPTCQNDVNECELGQSRCDNGATCINTIGGYECICPVGYTGQFCTADINECLLNPCLSGATCINNFGSYVCVCLPDYTGPNCEQGIQTSFLMSFPTLNLTYTPDLAFNTSSKFQRHAKLFCNDIDQLMFTHRGRFPDYAGCGVNSFKNNPVSLEILLDFMGVLSIPEMQQLVANVIFEETPRYRHHDVVGHLVGDLLVYNADLLLYQDNTVFDAWLTNSTSKIYGLPWTAADNLWDNNSFKFREYEDTFCSQIDTLFRSEPIGTSPLKQRYYRCFIDNFQHNYLDSEAPVSFTYSLVFNGTEPVIKRELEELVTGTSEVFEFSGGRWILVGDQWLIDEQNFDEIMINISNYLINVVTTPRPSEQVNTLINMTFRLLNFTMTTQLADRNSAEFKALAGPFCNYLTRAYRDRFPSYESCEVQSFFTKDFGSTQHVNFHLNFRGNQNADLPKLLIAIIIENAHREKINNRISLVVGPLNIFEDSLIQEAQSMVVTRGGSTIATPSEDPCVPDKNHERLPDPKDKAGYYICYLGKGYPSTCNANTIFDPKRRICTAP